MIEVEQTRTEIGYGNCFQACLASIFELPIEDIPDWNLNGGTGWGDIYANWLAERGLCMIEVEAAGVRDYNICLFPGHYIVGARSPRFKGLHAVVGSHGDIVWDPHPERSMGVGEIVDYTFFSPLMPHLSVRLP
jgi:hypothetical protein